MAKKGLCDTCISDTSCTFQAKLPVLQCEEFLNTKQKATKAKQPGQKKGKRLEQITTEE